MKKTIVLMSDNHSNWNVDVPDGDIFIHCGDWSYTGSLQSLVKFNDFLGRLPHKHKLYIPGNHELGFEQNYNLYQDTITNGTNINGQTLEIDGLRFFGCSYTPSYGRWAFMADDDQRKRYWETLSPDTVDVLITHGPAFGLADQAIPDESEHLGCIHLRKYVERVTPKVFAHGHIHGSGGMITPLKHWEGEPDTICANVSVMNEKYKVVRPATVIEV